MQNLEVLYLWSWRLDLNQRPADYKSAALPTELRQLSLFILLERETGLEPATYSLEGCRSSQLSYSRTLFYGGESRIRTCEG